MKIHKTLYATLAGRVDRTISYIDHVLYLNQCDQEHVKKIQDMLKDALLEVEDLYLKEEDI